MTHHARTEPDLIVVPDPEAAGAAAAERIATTLRAAVDARGRADWATTGGSTPVAIYRHLAVPPLADVVPWERVHVWWGDDRWVPRDHPNSNVKPLDDILLDIGGHTAGTATSARVGVHLPIENLHPFRTSEAIGAGRSPADCAADLEADLRAAGLETADGWPVLDLVLLGIGPDAHLLSVFPGSQAFDRGEWAMAIPAPTHVEPHVDRVTLNPAVVRVAREVLVVSHGTGKADMLATVFGAEIDPRQWPAQLARRAGATWILDEAAAARLPR